MHTVLLPVAVAALFGMEAAGDNAVRFEKNVQEISAARPETTASSRGRDAAHETGSGVPAGAEAEEMLRLINDFRAKPRLCGNLQMPAVPPLRWSGELAAAAAGHARDMAQNNYFSHHSRDGRTPFDRGRAAGYRGWGGYENIAAGNRSAAAAMQQWAASPGHCSNMMNAEISEAGMAGAFSEHAQYGSYWVQNFGTDPETFEKIKGFPLSRIRLLKP